MWIYIAYKKPSLLYELFACFWNDYFVTRSAGQRLVLPTDSILRNFENAISTTNLAVHGKCCLMFNLSLQDLYCWPLNRYESPHNWKEMSLKSLQIRKSEDEVIWVPNRLVQDGVIYDEQNGWLRKRLTSSMISTEVLSVLSHEHHEIICESTRCSPLENVLLVFSVKAVALSFSWNKRKTPEGTLQGYFCPFRNEEWVK